MAINLQSVTWSPADIGRLRDIENWSKMCMTFADFREAHKTGYNLTKYRLLDRAKGERKMEIKYMAEKTARYYVAWQIRTENGDDKSAQRDYESYRCMLIDLLSRQTGYIGDESFVTDVELMGELADRLIRFEANKIVETDVVASQQANPNFSVQMLRSILISGNKENEPFEFRQSNNRPPIR